MMLDSSVTLFHAPQTRSTGVVVLMEELGAPYKLQVLNMKAGEQRQAAYLAINPMGKVPAVLHLGQLVTEQAAIYLYLADLYPQAGLAPAIGEPLRGPYLRWMVMYGSCLEPAAVDRAMKREPASQGMCPYGDYDSLMATINSQLACGPYLLGERFSAADVLWGSALQWLTQFGLVTATPAIQAYVARIASRPAAQKVAARDAELAAEHAAAAAPANGA